QLVEVPARDHFNEVREIGRQVVVNDINNRPIIPVEDLLGPAVMYFAKGVQEGSFQRAFHAVWPKGGPAAVANLPPASMKAVKNIQYYDGPGADPKRNALDIYLPEGKTNAPVLFFVHGGRWRRGDKTPPPSSLINVFGRLGWGIVATTYRLSPAVKHPAHIQDVARAFAWVYKNASHYNIDRNRIVIIGSSAGGHLVALLALDTKYLEQEGVPPVAIKGVIPTSGIYEVASWLEPGMVPTGKEQAFGTDPEVLAEASPMKFLRSDAPPFLITYTDHDLYLLPEQAHQFYSAFLNRGLKARLLQIMNRTHFDYMTGVGQPPIALIDDILAVELVSFAAAVVGPTTEITMASAERKVGPRRRLRGLPLRGSDRPPIKSAR
ncbi:MAG: alpha/beta hydrolase, partial [Acidobacteria bacterium]|nr:alpha/beta hydrolase [Acidobacteriota bacterium]